MSDFFTAHKARMERNHETFMRLADELTKRGLRVYYSKDGLVSYIYVENDTHHIYAGFAEVPYRWYLNYDIEAELKQGSGRTLKEWFNPEEPFIADEIITNMKPTPKRRVPGPGPTMYSQLHIVNNPL